MWPAYVARKKKQIAKLMSTRLVHDDLFAPSLNTMPA